MPKVAGIIFDHLGPVIDVTIMPSTPRVHALKAAGLPYPPPYHAKGLIDTGAAVSGVDPEVRARLGLEVRGYCSIHTPSTGSAYEERELYDATVIVGTGQPDPLRKTLPVISVEVSCQGFSFLIGRDILDHCYFQYDGIHRAFTLEWAEGNIEDSSDL